MASFSVYTPTPDNQSTQLLFCVGLIALLLLADWFDTRRGWFQALFNRPAAVRWAVYYLLTALIFIALISVNTVQQFVYFKF